MSPWGRCQLSLVSLASVLFSCLQCLGHCLAKPKQICSAWYPVSSFWTFLPSEWPSAVFTAALGLCTLLLSETYWGQEVPNSALCDSSPRPFPVGLRSEEGDRQGQQNLPELQRPLCGSWGDSRQVCHGPETNDLAAMESLHIQIMANFFQSVIYGICSYSWTCNVYFTSSFSRIKQ